MIVSDKVAESRRAEALAHLDQSRAFYESSTGRLAANPLAMYYAFLNLGKVLIRTRGFEGDLGHAMHGLSLDAVDTAGDPQHDTVTVKKSAAGGRTNVFPTLLESLGFDVPANGTAFAVSQLMPQVVLGHRIWREASNRSERFVSIDRIEIAHRPSTKQMWLRLWIPKGDLTRYGFTRKQLINEARIESRFREVIPPHNRFGEDMLCFEQISPMAYSGRPSDRLGELATTLRADVWRIMTTSSDRNYRKYFLHLTPDAEASSRVPQLASLWLLLFYLGSVVRYQPHRFEAMLSERYGGFVTEFITGQREQLLYMLISEIAEREISKPAVI